MLMSDVTAEPRVETDVDDIKDCGVIVLECRWPDMDEGSDVEPEYAPEYATEIVAGRLKAQSLPLVAKLKLLPAVAVA